MSLRVVFYDVIIHAYAVAVFMNELIEYGYSVRIFIHGERPTYVYVAVKVYRHEFLLNLWLGCKRTSILNSKNIYTLGRKKLTTYIVKPKCQYSIKY